MLAELELLLSKHNWQYQRSDNGCSWNRGYESMQKISRLSWELRSLGYNQQVDALWARYSP